LLGVLRAPGEPEAAEDAPLPGLAQLDALVAQHRAAGLGVEVERRGAPRDLSAGADLAAYRIVQEALTNVRRHAGGAPATVLLAWEPGGLRLEVRDGGPGGEPAGDGGHGLLGMRE